VDRRPWLASYDPEVPRSISYGTDLIHSILEKAARTYPERTAVVFAGFTITYRRLWESVQQCARALCSLGVGTGDRVAIYLPNCPHYIIAYYAVASIGGVIVPTNPLYNEKELAFQIKDSGATTLVTLDLLYPRVKQVMASSGLARVIVGRIEDFLPALKKFFYPILQKKKTDKSSIAGENGVYFFHKLMKQSLPPCRPAAVSCDEVAVLQYTGGTTGVAKGAMLTHANIVSNTAQARHIYYVIREGREVFICVLPFFHSYGMAVAMNLPLAIGATLVILPRFVAKDVLTAIQQYRATILPGIPSIYSVLNSYKDIHTFNIATISYCISGAAPLPISVLEDFEKLTGGTILEGYGLSEASPITHCNPARGKRKVGSIGLPVPDTDCKIVDIETGQDLPAGEVGELCIRGPQVMRGYWQNPSETQQTLRDGWLFTGDVARMDAEGYFYIVERKKDMIISEGFNVYPREIEEFLLQHPQIADASVIGMPDKLRGEKVIAYVTLRPGEKAAPEEIIKYCRDNLVKYKVPKKVIFKDQIPTTIAGKKLRRVLREDAARSA
jgi:long-chain acyl-CoA synthetase